MSSLPYVSPSLPTILSLFSFLILLNLFRYTLDTLLYCGLLGEIFIGVLYGLPLGGSAWLSLPLQEAVQILGYLGLIALVFEGGLSTSASDLRKTVMISISVATVGLTLPIALSFLLLRFPFGGAYPSPLAAFSAGAALCSTSLGTTFAVLTAAGLRRTRIGVVLVGAAMMDDVVGLVMVQIIATLGSGNVTAWPITRPIVASFGLLLVTLVITPWILRPLLDTASTWLVLRDASEEKRRFESGLDRFKTAFSNIPHFGFMLATLVLVAFVTIAAFIDASVLLAAFIAGGLVKTLWHAPSSAGATTVSTDPAAEMYRTYYHPVVAYVLAPFFFVRLNVLYQRFKTDSIQASMGFAIPIRNMFQGANVWKGIVYSILMVIGKAAVGSAVYAEYFVCKYRRRHPSTAQQPEEVFQGVPHVPALIISMAMVARGEIGFLIASLSSSSGTLTLQEADSTVTKPASEDQQVFLVIIWATVVCTIIGPVGVGVVVRKLRSLESKHPGSSPGNFRQHILGRWA